MFEKNLEARSPVRDYSNDPVNMSKLTPGPSTLLQDCFSLMALTTVGHSTGWGLSEGIYLVPCQWHLLIKPKKPLGPEIGALVTSPDRMQLGWLYMWFIEVGKQVLHKQTPLPSKPSDSQFLQFGSLWSSGNALGMMLSHKSSVCIVTREMFLFNQLVIQATDTYWTLTVLVTEIIELENIIPAINYSLVGKANLS